MVSRPVPAADPAATAELLAAYVPPTLSPATVLATPASTAGPILDDTALFRITQKPHPTEAQRWDRFETEFGAKPASDSMVEGGLRSAKYNLDRTVFALDRFVANVTNSFAFEYRLSPKPDTLNPAGGAQAPERLYFSPWREAWENVRLRSDVDLNMNRGQAWIGMRLVVPFGD